MLRTNAQPQACFFPIRCSIYIKNIYISTQRRQLDCSLLNCHNWTQYFFQIFISRFRPHYSIPRSFQAFIRLVHNSPMPDSVWFKFANFTLTVLMSLCLTEPLSPDNLRPICLFHWLSSELVRLYRSAVSKKKCSCALRRLLCQICWHCCHVSHQIDWFSLLIFQRITERTNYCLFWLLLFNYVQ